jgi:predicted TIM-barrel fold metal-dependent hydrolase
MSHLANMIIEGVFVRWPTLKVMIVGGGVGWLPPYLWRLDYWCKIDHREAPWLKELPSEIFAQHVHATTYTLEAPRQSEMLLKVLERMPWIQSSLLYASGYPNNDGEEPAETAARLPKSWHSQIFRTNALNLFRWRAGLGPAEDMAQGGT